MTKDAFDNLYRCCPRKRRIHIDHKLVQVLGEFIAERRAESSKLAFGIRIALSKSSFLREIYSTSPNLLVQWSKVLNVTVPGFGTKKDLVKGKYEGGCKVWEATTDLAQFVTQDEEFIGELFQRNKDLRVLELGCGSGLVSLAFLSRLISEENFDSNYCIHLQDYNWEVLETYTLLNLALNLQLDYLEALIKTKNLRFLYGDWSEFRGPHKGLKYDLILTSETIYEHENFITLHDLLAAQLAADGYVVIATKDTYFGLSGGLYSWLDFIATRSVFTPIKMLRVTQTSVPRSILVLRKTSASERIANNFIDTRDDR